VGVQPQISARLGRQQKLTFRPCAPSRIVSSRRFGSEGVTNLAIGRMHCDELALKACRKLCNLQAGAGKDAFHFIAISLALGRKG